MNSTVSSLMATMAEDLGAGGFAGGAGGASVSDMRSGAARRMDPRGDGAKAEAEPTTRAETRSFPYFTMFFWLWALGGARWKGADGQLNDQCTESAGGVEGSGQQHGR